MITSVQTVLTCSKLISPQALNQVIQFVYGGQVDTKVCNLRDMKQVSLLNPDLNLSTNFFCQFVTDWNGHMTITVSFHLGINVELKSAGVWN